MMLSYFGIHSHVSKKPIAKKNFPIEEKLIHFQDYLELRDKLQSAKDKIQELETKLAAKETLQGELHKKIEFLTATLEQEKINSKEKQAEFAQEEDALNEEIAMLKLDLLTQESHYEILRTKIIQIQMQSEEQLFMLEQYKLLQAKIAEKERENELLTHKIMELEVVKKDIEARIIQEKNAHADTKIALEKEKSIKKSEISKQPTEKNFPIFPISALPNNATLFNNSKKTNSSNYIFEPWQMYSGF